MCQQKVKIFYYFRDKYFTTLSGKINFGYKDAKVVTFCTLRLDFSARAWYMAKISFMHRETVKFFFTCLAKMIWTG